MDSSIEHNVEARRYFEELFKEMKGKEKESIGAFENARRPKRLIPKKKK